jgi:hypothetical protein
MSSMLEALASSTTASSGTATSSVLSTASSADQMANYDAALQSELAQGIFGTGTSNLTGSLFSMVG